MVHHLVQRLAHGKGRFRGLGGGTAHASGAYGFAVRHLDSPHNRVGGILVAVAEEQPSPIHYIGVGEGIDDLDVFNAADYAKNLLEL